MGCKNHRMLPSLWGVRITECSLFHIAHVVGVATVQHLFHEAVIVRRVVARAELFKPLPVIGKDLFEDTPIPGSLCHHRVAPSGGDQIVLVKRLYHG